MATAKKTTAETRVTGLRLVTGTAKDTQALDELYGDLLASGWQPYCLPHWYGDFQDQVAIYFIRKEAQ